MDPYGTNPREAAVVPGSRRHPEHGDGRRRETASGGETSAHRRRRPAWPAQAPAVSVSASSSCTRAGWAPCASSCATDRAAWFSWPLAAPRAWHVMDPRTASARKLGRRLAARGAGQAPGGHTCRVSRPEGRRGQVHGLTILCRLKRRSGTPRRCDNVSLSSTSSVSTKIRASPLAAAWTI